jgi:hypothetical protein
MSNKSNELDNFINYLESIFIIKKNNQNDNLNFHVIPKIKVLNFCDIEKLKEFPGFSDVLKIVELVKPTDLQLDNFKDIKGNLNIVLASGDGSYDHNNISDYIKTPNVMKYSTSARIHIYLPWDHFHSEHFLNFHWILDNHFQNNILMIWLDNSKDTPEEFIKLFENKVDYITTDDIRVNFRPDTAASILKQNGLIKVEEGDERYVNNNDFKKVDQLSIKCFYWFMFSRGVMSRDFEIYQKK